MTPLPNRNPDSYLERILEEVPRYEDLQAAALDAVPFEPARVLELGFGTAETTQRLLDRFPAVRITGLDSSSEMVFKARELGWEDLRLGRIEDPLPDGPWDLVIAVLTVAELDADGVRDLFRRVRDHSRALVIGDVLAPEQATEWAEWAGGEVVWSEDGLAVVRAVYGE
jgi:tRNA (cmo5U34)-methyltransferase